MVTIEKQAFDCFYRLSQDTSTCSRFEERPQSIIYLSKISKDIVTKLGLVQLGDLTVVGKLIKRYSVTKFAQK